MAQVNDRHFGHGLAFGEIRHPIKEHAVALGNQVGRAGSLVLELRKAFADIRHALGELALGNFANLQALGDGRGVNLNALGGFLNALHLIDGALDDLILAGLEDLHLVEDRLVLLVVG